MPSTFNAVDPRTGTPGHSYDEASAADVAAAVDAARRAVELDTYRDSAWRLLVELHETTGDQAAAHATREKHRKVLEELGVPL